MSDNYIFNNKIINYTCYKNHYNMIHSNYSTISFKNNKQNHQFYVHSTSQQQSSQKYYKFKTQNNQDHVAQPLKSLFYTENKQRHSSLTKKSYVTESSKRPSTSHSKIQYFELDLKSIASKSCSKDEPTCISLKKQSSKDRIGKQIMNNLLTQLEQVQNNKKRVSGINDLSFLLQTACQKTVQCQQEQENIFAYPLTSRTISKTQFNPKIYSKANVHTKIKERITTKQQFQLKYKRLHVSRRDSKFNTKGIYCLQQKPNLNREDIKRQLQTKRIEKMIVLNGNQFKVTIEKIN